MLRPLLHAGGCHHQSSCPGSPWRSTVADETRSRPSGSGLVMDGVVVAQQTVIVVLAITRDGTQVPLGLRLGSTENAVVGTELLQDLLAHELPLDIRVLCILDGSKGLRKEPAFQRPQTGHTRHAAPEVRVGPCRLHLPIRLRARRADSARPCGAPATCRTGPGSPPSDPCRQTRSVVAGSGR
jgi:hypothetical protein